MAKEIDREIEAILFYKNEPISVKEIGKILDKSEEEVREGLEKLKKNLEESSLTLLENDNLFSLATKSEYSDIIEKIAKEEISGELSKAALETLSIILYREGASRREIDYIRGVNSNFILRSLTLRGLVEKDQDKDGRIFIYKPSLELLAHLGVDSVKGLPKFEDIQKELKTIENENVDG